MGLDFRKSSELSFLDLLSFLTSSSTLARLDFLKSSELRLCLEDFLKSSVLDIDFLNGADALKSSDGPRALLGASFFDCRRSSDHFLDCLKSSELPYVLDLVNFLTSSSPLARRDFLKSSELRFDDDCFEDFLKSADALKSSDEILLLTLD